jgi:two-component system, cell cycle response regulator
MDPHRGQALRKGGMDWNVLVVDDDRFSRQLCRDILEEDGFTVSEASGVDEALQMARTQPFDLVVTDLVMPARSGLDLLSFLKREFPDIAVIIITGHASIESAVSAMKLGAMDYVRKPLNGNEFRLVVSRAVEMKRLSAENSELRGNLKLFSISTRLAQCLEIEELYDSLFSDLMREVGGTRGFLTIVDQEKGQSKVALFNGFSLEENPDIDLRFYVAYKDETAHLTEPFIPVEQKPVEVVTSEGPRMVRSSLFLPLRNKHEMVGMVVIFDTDREAAFGAKEVRTLQFLVEHAQVAIDNAIRYEQAKLLTITDDLTNLFNYRYLNNILDRELVRAQRLNSPLSVLFLDLDSFKAVNDRFGHLVGSKLLIEMASILRECVRKVDAVARYGGDEYIVVLTDTGSEGATVVAERIRQSIQDHIFLENDGYGVRLTATIGVATYPEHAVTKIELLHLADKAMYRGKFGRKNVVFQAGAMGEDRALDDAREPGPGGDKKSHD